MPGDRSARRPQTPPVPVRAPRQQRPPSASVHRRAGPVGRSLVADPARLRFDRSFAAPDHAVSDRAARRRFDRIVTPLRKDRRACHPSPSVRPPRTPVLERARGRGRRHRRSRRSGVPWGPGPVTPAAPAVPAPAATRVGGLPANYCLLYARYTRPCPLQTFGPCAFSRLTGTPRRSYSSIVSQMLFLHSAMNAVNRGDRHPRRAPRFQHGADRVYFTVGPSTARRRWAVWLEFLSGQSCA